MKIIRHDDSDGEIKWFPALLVHKVTNCVALFTDCDTYTVLYQGNQVKEIGHRCYKAAMEQWLIFKGHIKIEND